MRNTKNTTIKMYIKKNNEKCYMFKVYCGTDPLTGKEQYTTRRGFKTKKEADLALARIKLEISNGTFKKRQVETYADVYELWIIQYEKTVEESTFIKTTGIFRNHILPALGAYKIDKMNVDVCQKHVDEWASKLKKYRMVKSYASKVFDFALKRGYVQSNPFTLVEMPNNLKKVQIIDDECENFYTKEQVITFLECMKQENNKKAYTLFYLLTFSGMRKGEALALIWSDIDFNKNEVRINKAVSRGKNNNLYVKTTKTGISRVIKMDPQTMSVLKAWKKHQRHSYLTLGFNTMQSKQLVFSNEQNEFLQPTKTRKWLEQVLTKYKLPKITTHGFRHTHCSLLFEAGVSIKEVQDRLGHTDVKTTMNIYAHVSQQAKDEAINKLANFMTM
ncbi:site-specific integrase [Lysinibacillus sp. G4S2]|uniref:site-specific integrase n=1 Tax=Lysinibacillus sp. G4S2 TaxID=3055859 RepID=UPI0025A2DE9A|nr:site-specific integrase [Lysinibacillus sp. G4S2]MDM5250105.1 site-specific integrase [Lysinibacillus sp. G4S2]